MLIGLDSCMVGNKVYRAYNDDQGLNRRFILNALDHANAVLGYEAFQKCLWTVRGEWNATSGSHEQYLIPLRDEIIEGISLKAGQKILIASSFKYDTEQQVKLWKEAGLIEQACWKKSDGSYGKLPFTRQQLRNSELISIVQGFICSRRREPCRIDHITKYLPMNISTPRRHP